MTTLQLDDFLELRRLNLIGRIWNYGDGQYKLGSVATLPLLDYANADVISEKDLVNLIYRIKSSLLKKSVERERMEIYRKSTIKKILGKWYLDMKIITFHHLRCDSWEEAMCLLIRIQSYHRWFPTKKS